jgi:hypothetical protein
MKDSMERIKKRISQKEVIEGNEVAAMVFHFLLVSFIS